MRTGATCLLLLLIAITPWVPALPDGFTLRTLEVAQEDGIYRVDFEVLLATEPARAREILADYHNWPRLAKNMSEPRLLRTFADGRERVHLSLRSCVLFLCKTIEQVKDIEIRPDGDIVSVMVPGDSDFRFGRERWQFDLQYGQTRVRYHAELAPGFALPPVIGPWVLKRKLRQTLMTTVTNLEALAAQ